MKSILLLSVLCLVGCARDGRDGRDGLDGTMGPQGEQGPPGEQGLQGPPGEQGTSGLSSATRIDVEPEGATCPYGGSRVSVGMDLNSDGNLGDDEVTGSGIVCQGFSGVMGTTLEGDATIANEDELLRYQRYELVTGKVDIEGKMTTVRLPNLRRAEGVYFELGIENFTEGRTVRLELPELEYVAGSFYLMSNPLLEQVSAPKLTYVGGAFTVLTNQVLPQCQVDAILAQLTNTPMSVNMSGNGTGSCP